MKSDVKYDSSRRIYCLICYLIYSELVHKFYQITVYLYSIKTISLDVNHKTKGIPLQISLLNFQ